MLLGRTRVRPFLICGESVAMKREFGQAGEALAVEFLKSKGYAILDMNWRCSLGELDIVALDGSTVVIVEVRTRHSTTTSTALETIGTRKQQTLAKLAHLYLSKRGLNNADWRIDAVGIAIPRSGTPIIEHVENALDW